MQANKVQSSIVTHPFSKEHHQQTGPYRGRHHRVAGFHSHFVSGSINHLKPVARAGAQTNVSQISEYFKCGTHERAEDGRSAVCVRDNQVCYRCSRSDTISTLNYSNYLQPETDALFELQPSSAT